MTKSTIYWQTTALFLIVTAWHSVSLALECAQGTIPDALRTTCILDANKQEKFKNALVFPPSLDGTGGGRIIMSARETQVRLGLKHPKYHTPLSTTVWGYKAKKAPRSLETTFPGPVIYAKKNIPLQIEWKNDLPLGHLLPIDTSIHIADLPSAALRAGYVPMVTHLHGSHVAPDSDGSPDAWYTQYLKYLGPELQNQDVQKTYYTYDNSQEATSLWYHDHTEGYTRLNAYAGLAGMYIVRDNNELQMIKKHQLPDVAHEKVLMLQDRMFTPDGQLFYPSDPPVPTAPTISIQSEFFGNVMLVNGAAWPKATFLPHKYRLHFANGSDSRFYHLAFKAVGGGNVSFYQIATDQGFLFKPLSLKSLVLAPGERVDIVVDFRGQVGKRIILTNDAKEPYPNGEETQKGADQVMAFDIVPSKVADKTVLAKQLRAKPFNVPGAVMLTRRLLLIEDKDKRGRNQTFLGTLKKGKLHWDNPITETPVINETEIWEIYNTTPDTHPIHLHPVAFQLLDRRYYTAQVDPITKGINHIKPGGSAPVQPYELGPKDTVQMHPGQVTRIKVRFDRLGHYTWHCHILSHEDNEMMRPVEVKRR